MNEVKMIDTIRNIFNEVDPMGFKFAEFPDDEYDNEVFPLLDYLKKEVNVSEKKIYEELVKIFQKYFHPDIEEEKKEYLSKISEKIYSALHE